MNKKFRSIMAIPLGFLICWGILYLFRMYDNHTYCQKVLRMMNNEYKGKIYIIDSIVDKTGIMMFFYDSQEDYSFGVNLFSSSWHRWRIGDSVYKPAHSKYAQIFEKKTDTSYWISWYGDPESCDTLIKNESTFFIPEDYFK